MTENHSEKDQEPEVVGPQDTSHNDTTEVSELGTNAQQVISALLGHQQDLVAELRSVYERLDHVRAVEYAQLEDRVNQVESQASGDGGTLTQMAAQVQELTEAVQKQSDHTIQLAGRLEQNTERHAAQLAERDARIGAQNARIDELELAITAAAESSNSAHEKLQVLAEETQSSLIHRVSERVSPAAQQARSAVGNIARRLRR